MKPHLFLPFFVALLACVLVFKVYKVIAGVVLALVLSSVITYFLDPNAAIQYLKMAQSSGVGQQPIPCLSMVLSHWLTPQSMWLDFLPAFLGSVWALIYFWRRRKIWNWSEHGNLLLLVSILATPYSYLNDEVLVIPALLRGAYGTVSRNSLLIIAFASALTEIAYFSETVSPSAFYLVAVWTAPVWLIWCLFTTRTARGSQLPKLVPNATHNEG